MRRWRCTSRFDPCGKGVRTGPHRQLAKKHFHFGGKHAILYDRIGEMNSSGAARRLRNGQFCRFNSHPARGRKNENQPAIDTSTRFDSPPQGDGSLYGVTLIWLSIAIQLTPRKGTNNRRNFSALHRRSRKVPSAFLNFCAVFQPGTAAEPFSECKKETPETKGQSL